MQKYIDSFTTEVFIEEKHSTENAAFAPLGAWVNLVIFAKSLENEFKKEQIDNIETVLCMSINDAFQKLQKLYRTSPESISFAIAFWKKPKLDITLFTDNLYKKIMVVVNSLADENKEVVSKDQLPTQEEIDSWVNENSKEIITEFPEDVSNPDLEAIIANIIALKIDWDEEYESKDSPSQMQKWNVEKILFKNKDRGTVLYKNKENEIFAIHTNKKTYMDTEDFIEVNSITGDTDDSQKLYDTLQKHLSQEEVLEELSIDDLETLSVNFATVEFREEYNSHATINYDIYYPAWDVAYKRDLNVSAGFGTVNEFFSNLEEEKEVLNYQVVNSSYHKTGYEAAALTYGMILRSAAFMPSEVVKNAYVTVFFDKPFVSITGIKKFGRDYDKNWFDEPLFISKIVKASEIED